MLLLLEYILIQIPAVQDYARKKIVAYLEDKIKTKVEIGKLSLDFPKRIVLQNVFFADQKNDTLLYGKELRVNIALFKLLSNEIDIQYISLRAINVNVHRLYPDTSFNYEYIVKAFAGEQKKEPMPGDSSVPMKFNIGKIVLRNINTTYKDDATGNDAYLHVGNLETGIKELDPDHAVFNVRNFTAGNIIAKVRKYSPTLSPINRGQVEGPSDSSVNPHIKIGNFSLQKVQVHYVSETAAMFAEVSLGEFNTHATDINLQNLNFILKGMELTNSKARIVLGKKIIKIADSAITTSASTWKFDVGDLRFKNNELHFNDENKPTIKQGIDYSHLNVQRFNLDAQGLVFTPEEYRGDIRQCSFTEQSGFNLKKLRTGFLYNDTTAYLKNLLLKTDRSLLKKDVLLKFTSTAALSGKPEETYIDADLEQCSIAVEDVLTFAPALSKNLSSYRNEVMRLNTSIKGYLKDISVSVFELSGLGDINVSALGKIKGLPDAGKAFYDLKIIKLSATKVDIDHFIPSSSLPSSVRLPETFLLTGSFKGSIKAFDTKLFLKTSKGNIDAIASLSPNENYNVKGSLQKVDAGYLLKQDTLMGEVSMNVSAKGKGFDVKKANADYNILISSAQLKKYDYRNLRIRGNLRKGIFNATANIKDSNIILDLEAKANMQNKYPGIEMKLLLDTINLHALHLTTDTISAHANLTADIPVADPDSLNGKILIDDINFTTSGKNMHTDSVLLRSSANGMKDSLHLYAAGILIADLTGEYQLTKIAQAVQQTINQYYHLPGADTLENIVGQNFRFDATLVPTAPLLQFEPALRGTDSVIMHATYESTKNSLSAILKTKKIVYNDQQADSITIFVNTKNDRLDFRMQLLGAKSNKFNLHHTSLNGFVANNHADFFLDIKDLKNKIQYRFGGIVNQVPAGVKFVLKPDSLILNYESWYAAADNYIQYDSVGLLAHNFVISNGSQTLKINSTSSSSNAPVRAEFYDFKIATITKIANQTSLNLDGNINGSFEVRDATKKPVFTSDLQLTNIVYNKDSVGNVMIKVNNEQANAFAAHVSIEGNNNDVKLGGMYYTGEGRIDLKLAMQQLNLASVKAFTTGQLDDIKGILKGDVNITGTTDKPAVNGSLNFLDAFITPSISGEQFRLSNEKIAVTSEGIHFDNFTLLDSASNKAIINGDVLTSDFRNYRFALTMDAEDFVLVNAVEGSGKPFYGKLNITSNIKLEGSAESPKIDADIFVNKETNFTLVLPSENPEVEDRKGVVIFEDKDRPGDTITVKRIDTISRQVELKGMDVSATIETDSAASFTLIIDERNGDALTLKGQADLAGGIDKSGKLSLTGNYQLQQGSYQVSLAVLKRKFDIQQGSTIIWTGDPAKANIDITAVYLANAAPIDLVQSQLAGRSQLEINSFKEKLPFQVILKMQGELLKPVFSFDINLPEEELSKWPDVDTKLQQVRADESELNKQVFALLLLNRFVTENPFVSASGGGGAEDIARQSASRILTDQLNQLAGSLIQGVDLTFDINSEQDYSTGTEAYRTDLTVGVSKRLLNDKLVVYVGSNFELEGPSGSNRSASTIAGDVAVDYKVSKDGRYKLRAYRKNEYEGVIEGELVETGLSFIFTLDYNHIRELFEPKKIKKRRVVGSPKPEAKRPE